MKPNEASRLVIGAALKVYTALGAGVLESTYDACLYYEFTRARLHFEHQVALPIVYEGIHLSPAYRVDFIVENCLIVETKCVQKVLPVHIAQLLTYLKLSAKPLGLLVNFNPASQKRHSPRNQRIGDRALTFVSLVSFVVPQR